MIALAGLLILVAGALLVGGLGNGETTMLWGSVAVSAAAAVVLVLNTVRRTRAARAEADEDDEPLLAPEPTIVRTKAPEPAPEPIPEPAIVRTRAPEPQAEAAAEPAPVPDLAFVRTEASEPEPEPAPERAIVGAEAHGSESEPVLEPEPASVRTKAPEPEPAAEPVRVAGPSTGSHGIRTAESLDDGEPVEEIVEVTDLLMILDLTDEVVVVDEHPRYHLAGCSQTAGEEEFPLPLSEAREDGFTACGICRPDRHLADTERQRRAAAKA